MVQFISEFVFSHEYWKWSLIMFFVLSFIAGIFKQAIEDYANGMPFFIQIIMVALISCIWPFALAIFLCLLPALLGWWLGDRIKNFKGIKKENFKLFD